MFLILNVDRPISFLCCDKQINVPEIILFFFFCDNKISITLGRKINILSKNVLILKLEAHLIETNLHTGVGMDLRVAETSVLLCNSLLLVLSSSWKMVRWLMRFSRL